MVVYVDNTEDFWYETLPGREPVPAGDNIEFDASTLRWGLFEKPKPFPPMIDTSEAEKAIIKLSEGMVL